MIGCQGNNDKDDTTYQSCLKHDLLLLDATVASVSLIVFLDGFDQLFFIEIRPCNRCKIKLGIGKLPKQEIGKPLLTACADQKIRIRYTCSIQIALNRIFW